MHKFLKCYFLYLIMIMLLIAISNPFESGISESTNLMDDYYVEDEGLPGHDDQSNTILYMG